VHEVGGAGILRPPARTCKPFPDRRPRAPIGLTSWPATHAASARQAPLGLNGAPSGQKPVEVAGKDGVPVPVKVVIELSIILVGPKDPAPLRWPGAFPAGDEPTASVSQWAEASLEREGVRLRFAYPAGWTLRMDNAEFDWFRVVSEDFTRLVVVAKD
jgi:hypothetical protein